MRTLSEIPRINRQIGVVHGEAFQIMLYRSPGLAECWVWNSRDGVTPFVIVIDGVEFNHAMNAYLPVYTAVLPPHVIYVFADYDRAAWEDLQRKRWERFATRSGSDYRGASFLARYPKASDWLAINPFEHGQPRLMERDEWHAWTSSWVGGMPQS